MRVPRPRFDPRTDIGGNPPRRRDLRLVATDNRAEDGQAVPQHLDWRPPARLLTHEPAPLDQT